MAHNLVSVFSALPTDHFIVPRVGNDNQLLSTQHLVLLSPSAFLEALDSRRRAAALGPKAG
jgi:hypothetical protein